MKSRKRLPSPPSVGDKVKWYQTPSPGCVGLLVTVTAVTPFTPGKPITDYPWSYFVEWQVPGDPRFYCKPGDDFGPA